MPDRKLQVGDLIYIGQIDGNEESAVSRGLVARLLNFQGRRKVRVLILRAYRESDRMFVNKIEIINYINAYKKRL